MVEDIANLHLFPFVLFNDGEEMDNSWKYDIIQWIKVNRTCHIHSFRSKSHKICISEKDELFFMYNKFSRSLFE